MEHFEEHKNRNSEAEALDEQWFSRFEKYGSFEAYTYFDDSKEVRQKEKDSFLSGENENPTLEYPTIDRDRFQEVELQLLQLKKEILDSEESEVVRSSYRWRLNEKIAEARMLQAAAGGDMHRFTRYSEFVYGKPSKEIFDYTINKLTSELEEESSDEIKTKITALLEVLPDVENVELQLPGQEVIDTLVTHTEREFSDLLTIESGEKLDANEIASVFQQALDELGLTDWSVEIVTTSKTGVSADQEKKVISVPATRVATRNSIKKLLVHEIGTHALRRKRGYESRLKLLSLGLDRYEQGEEGVATSREKIVDRKVEDFSGFDGHIAISLAKGLDGKKRSFREVFNILMQIYEIRLLKKGVDPEEARQTAQNRAWNRCVRTFRGTDCVTPGACFTKDMIYREGSVAVWGAIENDSDVLHKLSMGKFDPSNDRHLWILEQIQDEKVIN